MTYQIGVEKRAKPCYYIVDQREDKKNESIGKTYTSYNCGIGSNHCDVIVGVMGEYIHQQS